MTTDYMGRKKIAVTFVDAFEGVDPYRSLASAVVQQAAIDYAAALRGMKRRRRSSKALKTAAECESFFRSGYFDLLCGLDSMALMEKIRKEVSAR